MHRAIYVRNVLAFAILVYTLVEAQNCSSVCKFVCGLIISGAQRGATRASSLASETKEVLARSEAGRAVLGDCRLL
jgi:hypothetical protein